MFYIGDNTGTVFSGGTDYDATNSSTTFRTITVSPTMSDNSYSSPGFREAMEELDRINFGWMHEPGPWEFYWPELPLKKTEQQNRVVPTPAVRRSGRRRSATGVINFRRAA
jgi:hypothetical protein